MNKRYRISIIIAVCFFGLAIAGKSQSAPHLVTTYPESWGILRTCDHLQLFFSENVNEVAGKSIIIYNAHDDTPAMTFTLPSPDITGTGTDSIYIYLGSSLPPGDYYVNIDHGAFRYFSGVDFAGISDKETWKISILDVGIVNNSTWSGNYAIYTDLTLLGTLTIQSGSNIKFMGHYEIYNAYEIYAMGDENDSIRFYANHPATGWKGITMYNGSGSFSYCHFEHGHATGSSPHDFGGAISIYYPDVSVKNCKFIDNHASAGGGAIFIDQASQVIIENNVFTGNSAEGGGAMYIKNTTDCKISNNLFSYNSSSQEGGAISCFYYGSPTFYNNTFTHNQANIGGAVSIADASHPVFRSCIFYQNQATSGGNEFNLASVDGNGSVDIYYSLVEGGQAGINGPFSGHYESNIDTNPLFTNSSGWPFYLQTNSPCRNVGDPNTTTAEVGSTDLTGTARFKNGRIDMGAYEVPFDFDGFPGYALYLGGSNQYVKVPDHDALDLTDNFTIEAWIYPQSFNWLGGIVSKYQSPGADGYTLRLTRTSPHTGIEFGGQSTTTGVLEANQWYHIAAVREGGVNRIYINGVEQPLTGTPSTLSANSDPLCIGVDYLQSGRFFHGLIDEVRIWSRAFSSQYIREHINLPTPGDEWGMVAYWQFNSGSGYEAIDRVHDLNGALTHMQESDWQNSPIPFGDGFANSQFVGGPGNFVFTGTDVSMNFQSYTGSDSIVATRIDTLPNKLPNNYQTLFDDQYWVIRKYGNGQFVTDLSLTTHENLTATDETNPSLISLFKRTDNDTGAWLRWKTATSVDASTNTATFTGVDDFSQLMVGRLSDSEDPYIVETYPESWGILSSVDTLSLEFDEAVYEVSGKTLSIFNAQNNTVVQSYTLPSPHVSGHGSEQITIGIATSLPDKSTYYVLVDEGAFMDPSGNQFGGISDPNTFKFSLFSNGYITNNMNWEENMSIYHDLDLSSTIHLEPGTQVKFKGHYNLQLNDEFYASGTEEDSIKFFAEDTATGWKGLRVEGRTEIAYCIFENGNAKGSNNECLGGAIYTFETADLLKIAHSTFCNNRAACDGGAVYAESADPDIHHCVFENNHADMGGAISFSVEANPKVYNNLFVNNSATSYGGALIFEQDCNPHLYNNTFAQNQATYGGAVSCIISSNPVFTNCIFFGNTASKGGNQVNLEFYTYIPGAPDFYYCDVQGGTAGFYGTYSGTYQNNLEVDPGFKEVGDFPYALHKSSPCVNRGDPSTTTAQADTTDLAGKSRFQHGRIDIGAYETDMSLNGYPGTALQFDGSDDWINCGNDNSLDITDAITVELWIKPETMTENADVLSKGSLHWMFWDNALESTSGQGFQINLPGPGTTWWEFHHNFEDNRWYHVAWSFSSSGTLTAFVDGEIVRTQDFSPGLSTNTSDLKITPVSGSEAFKGAIDELRIWNQERSVQQIREHMYIKLSGAESGLVSYYQFNSGGGTGLADMIGANRGDLQNMSNNSWITSTIPFGSGGSNSQIVDVTSKQEFPLAGLEMDFIEKTASDTITASLIDTLPNQGLTDGDRTMGDRYWVINSFGDGNSKFSLELDAGEDLSTYHEMNPSKIRLFNRRNTSETAWTLITEGKEVDPNRNTVTFDSVSDFGQFAISQNDFDIYPAYAFAFDTAHGYLELDNPENFAFDTAFTLETWLYIDQMSVDYHTVMSKGDAWELRLVYSDVAIMLEFTINYGDQELSVNILTDTATMLKKWNHISCVYRHNGTDDHIKMYLNGVASNHVVADQLVASSKPVRIAESFKGKLDEIRIWNTARTTQQIRENMHLSMDYPIENLVSYHQLNEGEGIITGDAFGSNNGTFKDIKTPAGWLTSTIPFGGGSSNTQLEQTGTVEFPSTNLSINFYFDMGGSVTVSKIDVDPNTFPADMQDPFDAQYWIIERYGSGSFLGDLTFTPNELMTEADINNPGQIKLYHRPVNAETEWALIGWPDNIDLQTNQVTFEEIDVTGQFLIGRDRAFSGVPGHALLFKRDGGYVQGSDINTGIQAFTLEAWVKHDSIVPHVQRYMTIEPELGVIRHGGNIQGDYGDLQFYIRGEEGQLHGFIVDSVIPVNRWVHVAGSYDGVHLKLYLNGRLLKTEFVDVGLYPPTGHFFFSSASEGMTGQLDELRIWDEARNQQQIKEGMHRVFNLSQPNLIHYWQLNEGSGITALDTANSASGTLLNMDPASRWMESTMPAGMGSVNTQVVTSTGNVVFDGTDVSMHFDTQNGTDSITVTKIELSPNTTPQPVDSVFDSQYWVVEAYGTDDYDTRITFKPEEELTANDETRLSHLLLYSRSSNSDSNWVMIDSAYAVDAAANTITFIGIKQFSQFLIVRGEFTIYPPGNCLRFDGVDDYVEVPADPSLNLSVFTVEFWIRMEKGAADDGVIDYSGDDYPRSNWYFENGNNYGLRGVTFGVNQEFSHCELNYQWSDSNWHHIAGVYDGNAMLLYVDGHQHGVTGCHNMNVQSNVLLIGKTYTDNQHTACELDEIRIWSYVRSEHQIREYMHKPLEGNENHLVSYWSFDESKGGVARDLSHDNDGILHNMSDDSWQYSTAPVPYFTVRDGTWETVNTWAKGQAAPEHSWSRVRIEHQVTLNANLTLLQLLLGSSGILTVSPGFTLTVSPY